MGAQLFSAGGAAFAGACGAGSRAPVSASGQQVAQLHRAVVGQRRLWPVQRNRHCQGATGLASPDSPACTGVWWQHGFCPVVQCDSGASGRAVSGPRSRAVLTVSCHPALRTGGGRGRHRQPAHGLAPGLAAPPLWPGGAPGGIGQLFAPTGRIFAQGIPAARTVGVPGQWSGEPGALDAADRSDQRAGIAFSALQGELPCAGAAAWVGVRTPERGRCDDPSTV